MNSWILIFAAVGLPGAIGLPGCRPGSLFVCKITRRLLDSFRKDVKGPLAKGFVIDRDGGTLLSFVAHKASIRYPRIGMASKPPSTQPQTPLTEDLWCPTCARAVRDPLVCGDCSAVLCRICGTPLESADELAFG